MNNLPKIYISGKISNAPNLNKPKFEAATALLIYHLGYFYKIINPHELPHNHNKQWNSYMKPCIKALCDCIRVYVLDDWKSSRGALVEVLIAKILSIDVYEIETLQPLKVSYATLFVKLLFKL